MCEPLYFLIIKLAYVFSAQDESLPNFVVFRGSVPSKWQENLVDDLFWWPLTKESIKIKNYQDKRETLRSKFSIYCDLCLFHTFDSFLRIEEALFK